MQKYGAWIVEDELGKGDFATVYRVRRDDVIGAVKVCRPGDALARHRHGVELASLTKLDHPSIPKVLDHVTEGDSPYFVMTYAPADSSNDS